MWTDPKNWSTGRLPGPADDVCITNTGDDVLTSISISVHSLLLGSDAGIALNGTSSRPLTATVATGITMTPGGISRIDLTLASINAAKINDQGGFIYTDFNCSLTSPDIVFGAGGSLQAANGTTTLTSLPQLSNGTLTGATIHTDGATVVVPGDITHLVAANVTVGASLFSGFGGLLAVSGQATLAGSVSASEFVPKPGDTSPLITFGSLSGNFTGHGLGIVLAVKPHEIDAIITPQIAASPTTAAPGGRAVGTATAGIRGNFAVTVTIPASAKVGSHHLIAVGSDGDQASTTITVS